MADVFKFTEDQQAALKLIGGTVRNLLLFGGSRSGKTLILLFSIVLRALKAPGSRHAVFRFRKIHVKEAVLLDSFPKLMKLCFPGIQYKSHEQAGYVRFRNGAEIWFMGLDSKERVDKILGREYATVYFNECSEISYPAVTTAMTRLAQRVKFYKSEELLPNRAWFDCNPPGKSHWSYKLFIQKVEPDCNTALLFPDTYDSMLINPQGNKENLGEGYLEETLAQMPERQRQRFLEGCWLDDMEGALWKREMIDRARVINAPQMRRVVVGVDPAMTREFIERQTGFNGALQALAMQLLLAIIRHASFSHGQSAMFANNRKEERMEFVRSYLKENSFRHVDVAEICSLRHTSRSHFHAEFLRCNGCTMLQYLNRLRCQHAIRLLRESDLPLEKITEYCGFGSLCSLYRILRQETGNPPASYRDNEKTIHPLTL